MFLIVFIAGALSLSAAAQHAYAEDGQAPLTAGETAASDPAPVVPEAVVSDGLFNISSVSRDGYSISVKGESTKAKAKAILSQTATTNWAQKWIVVRDATTGYYSIRNLGSRMMLGVSGKVKSGAVVKQLKQAGASSAKQLWMLYKNGNAITFRSAANPSLALTVSGKTGKDPALKLKPLAGAQATPSPSETQQFTLKEVGAIEDAHSFFVCNAKTGKAVSVLKNSRKNNAKLGLEKKKAVRNQKFRFFDLGKSTYNLQCASSCKYVGAKGGALRQYSSKAGKTKKWKVALDYQTGTFSIASAASPAKRLDASANKLSLKAASAAQEQQFVLIPTYGFKVYLDPGHGRSGGIYDPGAEGSGREEAPLTKDLVNRIEEQLEGTDVEVVNGGKFDLAYWQRRTKAASLKCDVVLSAHFDTDGAGGTTSTMVGTSGPLSQSMAFNRIIHANLVSSTGLGDGGTMHRSDITIVNGKVPSVLMEVCFIDDPGSLRKYLNRRDSVAQSLAQGIVQASQTPGVQR